jgi:hypothetical protein
MKIDQDHAQFVQDLVLRITSNADFKPENGAIDRACKHAFAVGRDFFPLWDAERAELEAVEAALEPRPSPKGPTAVNPRLPRSAPLRRRAKPNW